MGHAGRRHHRPHNNIHPRDSQGDPRTRRLQLLPGTLQELARDLPRPLAPSLQRHLPASLRRLQSRHPRPWHPQHPERAPRARAHALGTSRDADDPATPAQGPGVVGPSRIAPHGHAAQAARRCRGHRPAARDRGRRGRERAGVGVQLAPGVYDCRRADAAVVVYSAGVGEYEGSVEEARV